MILKKILSILNYMGAALLLLLAFLSGHAFYPILYPFRKFINEAPVFTWWFDDTEEDGYYGAEYWQLAKGLTVKIINKADSIWIKISKWFNNFWISYRWNGMRNPMWKVHIKIAPRTGTETIIYSAGKLVRNGVEISLINGAVFMYVDKNGNYTGNAGEFFSEKYSAIGWSFIWFTKKGRVYWRFSFAKRITGSFGINIQIGAFYRYIFKIKFAHKILK